MKTLVYGGVCYEGFLIGEHGVIMNRKTGRFLRPVLGRNGYYLVTLPMGHRGKVKSIRVHKALAETFIPNPNNLPLVHHKDEDKQNNNLDNLEWTTNKDNVRCHIRHQVETGNPYINNRKLTQIEVNEICTLSTQLTISEIAKIFSVSKTTIINICNNIGYVS